MYLYRFKADVNDRTTCVNESSCGYLVQLYEQGVEGGQLPAQVDVSVEASRVGQAVGVGDLLQEALHVAPLTLHKVVHEQHVLLLVAEPAENTEDAIH